MFNSIKNIHKKHLLESKINKSLLAIPIHRIFPDQLKNNKIYLHGGFIRDLYYDKKFNDIDVRVILSTKEDVQIIKKIFKNKLFYIKEVDLFLSKIKIGKYNYDISFVFKKNLINHMKFTDYRINSVYFNLKDKKIIDPFNGISNLKIKKLDTVINPQDVFLKYPIYILRGIRLMLLYDLKFSERAVRSIKKSNDLLYCFLSTLSHQRNLYYLDESKKEIQKCIKFDYQKFIQILENLTISKDNIDLILSIKN